MNKEQHEEMSFWDEVGSKKYVSLSNFDRKRIRAWIGQCYGKRVLDLGGGSGMISSMLNAQEVYCADISIEMLKHSPAINVQADALQLPFQDKTFDLVIAAAFFHHLPYNHKILLSECFRVLKSGGIIMGYDPSNACLANRIFMGKNIFRLKQFSPEEEPISSSELCKLATQQGFVEFEHFLFTFRNPKVTLYEFIQRYALNFLSIGVMRKYFERWFFWQARKMD